MIGRVRRMLQFRLERFLLGGPHYRLLVIGAIIVVISAIAGAIKYEYEQQAAAQGSGEHEPEPLSEDIWWAFLRMTDPGYLGDDEGTLLRTISTIVTICGYVLFMGALIAIMTQWLHTTIRKLEQGLTPIARRNHVAILGWTERTPEILREILAAEGRVRRFLKRMGARRLTIAVLAPDVDHDLVVALRERLGELYARSQIILRSGSPLHIDHLRRVDYARAAVLVLPGADQAGGPASADHDARTIKTILTVSHHAAADGAGGRPPLLVAAVHDTRLASMARAAYGDGHCEVIASDGMVGRLMAQNLRHAGLSYVLDEILSQDEGNEIYLRAQPELVGRPVRSLAHHFDDAVVLGLLRGEDDPEPLLNPGGDELVQPGDRLILLSPDYEVHRARSPRIGALPESSALRRGGGERRILVLGWNHAVPTLLRELDSHRQERLHLDLFSSLPLADRERLLDLADASPQHLSLRHFVGDYALPGDLAAVDLASYDSVLIVGSDRLETAEDADARTLLGHHLVGARLVQLPAGVSHPAILVELRDPTNADLFDSADTEVIATGEVLAHTVAQVALRGELRAVFDLLFGPGGPEIVFRPLREYGLGGRTSLDFADVIDAVARRGETALGLRLAGTGPRRGGVELNPPRRRPCAVGPDDEVIVLTTWAGDPARGTRSLRL